MTTTVRAREPAPPLYEADFVRWTEEQGAALREAARSAINLPLDWENLAEEIESLGRQQRGELHNRLATICEHLLKLETSPARDPRPHWRVTIRRSRTQARRLLKQNPSLEAVLDEIVGEAQSDAREMAIAALEEHGEATPALLEKLHGTSYSAEQLLGDWLPDDPPTRTEPVSRSRRAGRR